MQRREREHKREKGSMRGRKGAHKRGRELDREERGGWDGKESEERVVVRGGGWW